MSEQEREYFYRYKETTYCSVNEWDEITSRSLRIHLEKYVVLKHTPKGVWIVDKWSHRALYDPTALIPIGEKRFVLLSARKRFACPTIEEAKESFIARKKRQIRILNAQLKEAETALWHIQNKKEDESTWIPSLEMIKI